MFLTETTPAARPQTLERTFATFDGTPLFYRAWLPRLTATKAVVLFHRGHEHSGRWDDFVERLNLPEDTAVFAWDARGHGRSPGDRGYAAGLGTLVRDTDCFVRHVCREHGFAARDVAVVAHSVAAVVVAAWVHDYAPAIRGMVLATPAFDVKLYVPLARPALRAQWAMKRRLAGDAARAYVKSYVRPSMITNDVEQQRAYATDPLISRQIAVNVLLDLHDTAGRVVADAGAITTPTFVLTAGNDWVVKNEPARRFVASLSSPFKRHRHYGRFKHAIFHDTDRDRPIADVREFLTELFDRDPAAERAQTSADRAGYTRTEYDRLRDPLPQPSPRRLWFAAQRTTLRTIGLLSRGIRVGWQHGFDSGQSLDHVYRNRPEGKTPLGRLIDRQYLTAVGWRGIRQRKVHLQQLLRQAINARLAKDEPAHVLDLAAGPGRYLLEVLDEYRGKPVTAELRDRSTTGLEAGRTLAGQMNLTTATYCFGDAFSYASVTDASPRPNVVVVSGLYELFPDNAPLRESLRGIVDVLPDDGTFIYTNQPWHPQVEMIARVLTNRDGEPWVMRRRTQAEMDALVRAAGFEKLDMLIDRDGIFTVSIARKVPS